ncbi:unnamed protein product [Durusdinium trenchii]|uniref:Pyridoxamine 5'-phosphate oxidase family protein n=1 Tax=Durusdinium trenchii TaxID=1381693 RepID=A0ABP0HR67_9DINO
MAYAQSQLTKLHRSVKRGSYDKELVAKILDAGVVAHVAFVDAEGHPKVSPMIYGRAGDALYLHGHLSAGLLRNGSIDVCFCMTLEDGLVLARSGMHSSMNYRCVMVHGKAEELEGDAKWKALDLIVDHSAGEGWASQLRPMTSAEVQSTRVLKLKLEDGKVSAKVRAEGANDDKEDIENLNLWAGIIPITRVYGPPVNNHDSSLRPPEQMLRRDEPPCRGHRSWRCLALHTRTDGIPSIVRGDRTVRRARRARAHGAWWKWPRSLGLGWRWDSGPSDFGREAGTCLGTNPNIGTASGRGA